jgi:flagellar hook-associated protein 1 FlgK
LSDAILASADAIAAGTTGKESDGGLAHQMAALRDASQGNLGNRSFTSYYENALNTMASESAYYRQQADVAGDIKTQVENQQLAVSGVSIDEEMAEMVKFQRSYQAAAKALTIFDQMTEDIINMVRR